MHYCIIPYGGRKTQTVLAVWEKFSHAVCLVRRMSVSTRECLILWSNGHTNTHTHNKLICNSHRNVGTAIITEYPQTFSQDSA